MTTDNFSASVAVGAHLAGHGYTDWLFLVYPALWSTRVERERGIREAAAQFGASLVVLESANNIRSAYTTLANRLDRGTVHLPRAIIAGNNPMVHGALRVLQDRRLKMPNDVAVTAFDEFAWAELLDPPLTVLNENSEAIGTKAATTLMRLIDGQLEAESSGMPATPAYRDEDRLEVEGKLIIRRSCGC